MGDMGGRGQAGLRLSTEKFKEKRCVGGILWMLYLAKLWLKK